MFLKNGDWTHSIQKTHFLKKNFRRLLSFYGVKFKPPNVINHGSEVVSVRVFCVALIQGVCSNPAKSSLDFILFHNR